MTRATEAFGGLFSKSDANIIFSMNKKEWEKYLQQRIFPEGWKVRLSRHDTGSGIMGLNDTNIYGMSIQPLFPSKKAVPDAIIVGHYFADSVFPSFTDELKKQVEEIILNDLEPEYSVRFSYPLMPPYTVVEISVTHH